MDGRVGTVGSVGNDGRLGNDGSSVDPCGRECVADYVGACEKSGEVAGFLARVDSLTLQDDAIRIVAFE